MVFGGDCVNGEMNLLLYGRELDLVNKKKTLCLGRHNAFKKKFRLVGGPKSLWMAKLVRCYPCRWLIKPTLGSKLNGAIGWPLADRNFFVGNARQADR